METIIAVVGVGILFVLMGRWLYRNPNKLVPKWGLFNPENPFVQKMGRFYGTFLIFAGILASGAVTVPLLVAREFTVIVSLPLAILGAWYLRPGSPKTNAAIDAPAPRTACEPPPKQRLFNRHWKRNLAILGGITLVLLAIGFAAFGDSDVCKLAFSTARASMAVRQRLGEPVKRGFFTSGTIEISGPTGKADIEIPISGPKGTGTLFAVAHKSAGIWKFDTLDASFAGHSDRISLLEQESAQPQ